MSLPTWEEKEGRPGVQTHPQLYNPAWIIWEFISETKTKFYLNR